MKSDYVCEYCLDSLLQSFVFTSNVKATLQVLNVYMNNLSDNISTCCSQQLQNMKSCDIPIFLESAEAENFQKETKMDHSYANVKRHLIGKAVTNEKNHNCSECNGTFKTHKQLLCHKRRKHSKRLYSCDVCGKVFKNEEYLKLHFSYHLVVKCKFCPEVLPEAELSKHLIMHHNGSIVKCEHCNEVFYNKNKLRDHLSIVHKKSYGIQCGVCLKQLRKEDIPGHQCRYTCPQCKTPHCRHHKYLISYRDQKLQSNTVKCIHCKFRCCSKGPLIAHVNRVHLKYQPFSCTKCGLKFYSQVQLKRHLITHKGLFECGYCDQVLNNQEELSNHIEICMSVQRPYKCNNCKASFLSEAELSNHLTYKHMPVYKCELCEKQFLYKYSLMYHVNNTHTSETRLKIGRKRAKPTDGQQSYICETCGKFYNNIDGLKSHLRIHAEKVPCPECGKLVIPFRMAGHRRMHDHARDPSVKPPYKKVAKIKCNYCDYISYDRSMLESHINGYHNKIKPYTCEHCNKSFTGHHNLKRHLQSHKNTKSKMCEVCSKVLANMDCLRTHLRIHTGEKPYPCDVCGQTFRSASIMNFHKNRVHADKTVECPLCGNMFFTLIELRRHVRKVHWKKQEKFNYKEIKELGEEHYHLFHDGRTANIECDEDK
jgi:KRAB domain-containing zinc finger protein